jgi:hypothetical protein
MNVIRPSRRKSLRATDLDGNELLFAFSISRKLYECPYCREAIDVGREHTLVRYVAGPAGTFHQHWHTECAAEQFKREVRNVREVPAR